MGYNSQRTEENLRSMASALGIGLNVGVTLMRNVNIISYPIGETYGGYG
jgi:hypothetical protein